MPAAYSLIADRFPPARLTTANSLFAAGPTWGQAAAYAIGGAAVAFAGVLTRSGLPIVSAMTPWQITFIEIGLPGGLLAFLALSFAEPPRRAAPLLAAQNQAASIELLPFLRSQTSLLSLLAVGFTLMCVVMQACLTWVPAVMTRLYGWSPARFGPVLSLVSAFAALFLVAHAAVVDRLFARGMRDCHIRYCSWLLMAACPLALVVFMLPAPGLFLAGLTVLEVLVFPFMLFLTATIQLIVPNQLRGRVTAVFVFFLSFAGFGFGPLAVGSLTQLVFKDPGQVGKALALVACGGCLGALIALRAALAPLRRLIAGQDPLGAPPPSAVGGVLTNTA